MSGSPGRMATCPSGAAHVAMPPVTEALRQSGAIRGPGLTSQRGLGPQPNVDVDVNVDVNVNGRFRGVPTAVHVHVHVYVHVHVEILVPHSQMAA